LKATVGTPLVLTEAQVDEGLTLLEESLVAALQQ